MGRSMMAVLYLGVLQREVRSRTVIVFFTLTLLWAGGTSLVLLLAASDTSFDAVADRVVAAVFFAMLGGWNTLLGLVFGVGCLRADMEAGTMGQLLAFPVSRRTVFASRTLGVLTILAFYYLLGTGLGVLLYRSAVEVLGGPALVLVRPLLWFLQALPAVALGTLLSLFVGRTPALLLAGVVLFLSFLAEAFMSLSPGLVGQIWSGEASVWYVLVVALRYGLPSASALGNTLESLMGGTSWWQEDFWLSRLSPWPADPSLGGARAALEIGHFALATGALFWVAFLLFRRRSF